MQTIALRLDPDTRYKLEQLAHATGLARSTIVAEAVRRFVDAELAALIALGEELPMPEADDEQPALPERWNLIV